MVQTAIICTVLQLHYNKIAISQYKIHYNSVMEKNNLKTKKKILNY
jgi:hypothetical protein